MQLQGDFIVNQSGVYTFVVNNIEESDNLNIIAEHLEGYCNDDVKRLFICKLELTRLPQNLGKMFPNLITLSVQTCEVEKLERSDLKGLKKLEELFIVGNNLSTLPNDLFNDTPCLQYISFYGNKIQSIGPNIFDNLLHLKYINLQLNKNYDLCFKENSANGMNLRELKESIKKIFNEQNPIFMDAAVISMRIDDNFYLKQNSIQNMINSVEIFAKYIDI